jgi:voltage-gated potassium channel Kch
VVILGFGQQGQMLASMLSSPLAAPAGGPPLEYLAVDADPARAAACRAAGLRVVHGDCARAAALRAAGVRRPAAVAVCCEDAARGAAAVAMAAGAFQGVRIYACAEDFR